MDSPAWLTRELSARSLRCPKTSGWQETTEKEGFSLILFFFFFPSTYLPTTISWSSSFDSPPIALSWSSFPRWSKSKSATFSGQTQVTKWTQKITFRAGIDTTIISSSSASKWYVWRPNSFSVLSKMTGKNPVRKARAAPWTPRGRPVDKITDRRNSAFLRCYKSFRFRFFFLSWWKMSFDLTTSPSTFHAADQVGSCLVWSGLWWRLLLMDSPAWLIRELFAFFF